MRKFLLVVVGVVVVGCATSAPDVTDEAANYEAITELLPCPVGQWCIEPPPSVPVLPLLHSVWAVSANDVFAVGDNGTIWHRTSSGWSAMSSGTTSNLRGVWAASASDVWAVGVKGTVLRYNGTAWSTVNVGSTSDFDAVWGASSTNVWLVGSGNVLQWNGTGYTSYGFSGTLLSVSGTGPTDVWTTGESTFLHHFTGTWSLCKPDSSVSTMFAVLAVGVGDVWVSDLGGLYETMHLVGGQWVGQRTGGAIFNSMAARSPTDIWGTDGSRVGRWNGVSWQVTQPFGTSKQLWSVTTTPGHLWVVGDGGFIAHQAF